MILSVVAGIRKGHGRSWFDLAEVASGRSQGAITRLGEGPGALRSGVTELNPYSVLHRVY